MDKSGSKIWFKTRDMGWGWTPASPEGQFVVGLFLVLAFAGVGMGIFAIGEGADKAIIGRILITWIMVLTLALLWIANKKGDR